MLFRESETIELKKAEKKSLLWIFSEGQTALIILQRKECVRRAYMSGRAIPRFRLLTRRFAI